MPPSVFQRLASAAPALYHSVRQGTSPVPVRVWIDGHDLVRRVLVDDTQLEGGTSPGSANVQMHIFTETDFFDFGVPVNVTVPPASEVLTLRQLIRVMAADVPKQSTHVAAFAAASHAASKPRGSARPQLAHAAG